MTELSEIRHFWEHALQKWHFSLQMGRLFSRYQAPSAIRLLSKEAPMGFFDKLRDAPTSASGASLIFIIFSAGVGRDAGGGAARTVPPAGQREAVHRPGTGYVQQPLSYSVA